MKNLFLILPSNCRFQNQHLPLDLPPSSPAGVEDDEEIIIEHKTVDELNELDPYEFPVCQTSQASLYSEIRAINIRICVLILPMFTEIRFPLYGHGNCCTK